MVKTLRLADFVAAGQCCHYARVAIRLDAPGQPHRHDFHELFWVLRGQGIHHVNGDHRPLAPDRLVLVRDTDAHALSGDITILNIAFAPGRWTGLVQAYSPVWADPVAGPDHRQREFSLTAAEKHSLLGAAGALAAGDRSALATDLFLLSLMRLLGRKQHPATTAAAAVPGWLSAALQQVGTAPVHFQSTRAFARLAGRCPAHLARAVRRWTGRTPTDIINEARLAYAARRLVETDDKIMAIALDCGINTLGYFYRLFSQAYGMAPQAYRLHHRSIVNR